MARRSILNTTLVAGLTAGTLDILDPIIFYRLRSHVPATRILQSVASGLVGKSAFTGGWQTAALGLALHLCIALSWAAFFVLAARAIPALRRRAVVSGLTYGVFIFAIMNYVILPMSRAAPQHAHWSAVFINAVIAIVFLVGLPIALITRRMG